jgi:hypothetical protein
MICQFASIASVQRTSLHNKKRSLTFLLNRREQFPVKQFTLFVSLLTRALCLQARCLHAHDVCIIQTYYTSFGAAAQRRPESLMLGTEHRILYTIWLKEAHIGRSSSSMTAVNNNNKRIRNGADSCFLTTTIMIEKTLSFLSMMTSLRCLFPHLLLPRPLEKAPAATITTTIKKIQKHR